MGAGASIEETQKVLFIKELKEIMQDESKPPEQLIKHLKEKGEEILKISGMDDPDDTTGPGTLFLDEKTKDQEAGQVENDSELVHGGEGPGGEEEDEAGLDNSASIQRLAASFVLERTAEFRINQKHADILKAKDSFGRQPTDTSMNSNNSSISNDNLDLASLLPPPRMSIDVDLANENTSSSQNLSAQNSESTPTSANPGALACRRVTSYEVIKFKDTNGKTESWVLSDNGAMRLDDYERMVGPDGIEDDQGKKVTQLIPSDFVQVNEVGRGASGHVFKALHRPTLTLVALKCMPMASRSKRIETKSELQVLYSQLKGLNETAQFPWGHLGVGEEFRSDDIVTFYDAYSTEDGYINLVMEYMEGGSLKDLIARGGCRNETVLRRIGLGVTRALSHLHKNKFLHRDVKPANVLLSVDGKVKLADFGISKNLNSTKELAQTFTGTFLYMSPERIASKDYDIKADVWSMGLMLFSVALGRYPIEIENQQAAYWELYDRFVTQDEHNLMDCFPKCFSADFRDFVERCLKKDPEERMTVEEALGHRFLSSGEVEVGGGGGFAEVGSMQVETSMLREARETELKELVAVCQEGGMKFSRKHDHFEALALQLGLEAEFVKDTFCPLKPKAKKGGEAGDAAAKTPQKRGSLVLRGMAAFQSFRVSPKKGSSTKKIVPVVSGGGGGGDGGEVGRENEFKTIGVE
ncbi:hypothetical protein TrVE_jg6723 [Triparma verrucosa]|uniref:mitogen-activated protein kinase kinase n=1 Tax=Triparma verrucosa TaxID=1606542 RepID=A0A9W7BQY7_9STRA|nr:hypothetical protein TrVE_jg6723 [Triparma verrucosa]